MVLHCARAVTATYLVMGELQNEQEEEKKPMTGETYGAIPMFGVLSSLISKASPA